MWKMKQFIQRIFSNAGYLMALPIALPNDFGTTISEIVPHSFNSVKWDPCVCVCLNHLLWRESSNRDWLQLRWTLVEFIVIQTCRNWFSSNRLKSFQFLKMRWKRFVDLKANDRSANALQLDQSFCMTTIRMSLSTFFVCDYPLYANTLLFRFITTTELPATILRQKISCFPVVWVKKSQFKGIKWICLV